MHSHMEHTESPPRSLVCSTLGCSRVCEGGVHTRVLSPGVAVVDPKGPLAYTSGSHGYIQVTVNDANHCLPSPEQQHCQPATTY